MTPESIKIAIESKLEQRIVLQEPLHGGDINSAVKLGMDSGEIYFLKWNKNASKDMFEAEARGLQLLASADTELIVPQVLAVGKEYLLLEFIEERNSGASFDFGVQLARLHKNSNELFGLDHSNYIGRLPQSNKYHPDWLEFFMRERLEPQVKMGIDSGKLSKEFLSIFDRVMNYTYVVFPEETPALLHGDLWGGNYMFTNDGTTCIYDPAVYFGHREMDIAMTRLFGGFDPDFYRGYNEEYPFERGWEERIKLCNLYPVLVHANLFGGSYCNQAEALLRQFF